MQKDLLTSLPIFLAACQKEDWEAAFEALATVQLAIDEQSPWFTFVNENTLPLLSEADPQRALVFELWQTWLVLLEAAEDAQDETLLAFSSDSHWPSPFTASHPAAEATAAARAALQRNQAAPEFTEAPALASSKTSAFNRESPENASNVSENTEQNIVFYKNSTETLSSPLKIEASQTIWPISTTAQEILTALAEGLALLCQELTQDFAALDTEQRTLHHHHLAALESAAEVVSLMQLAQLLSIFNQSLKDLEQPESYTHWRQGLDRAYDFLQAPTDAKLIDILEVLQNFTKEPNEIKNLGISVKEEIVGIAEERHVYHFDADSFNQNLPTDLNPEILKSFQQEAPHLIAALSSLLEMPELDIIQAERLAHTLKGNAAMVGLNAISSLTHFLEDILERLHKNTLQLTQARQALLLEVADVVGELLEKNLAGEHLAEAPLQDLSRQLQSLVQLPPEARTNQSQATAPAREKTEKSEASTTASTFESQHLDTLLQQIGELQLSLSRSRAELALSKQLLKQMQDQDQKMQISGFALETLADIQGMHKVLQSSQAAHKDYDPLELEEYQEWYSLARQLLEISADSRNLHRELQQRLQTQEELLREEQQHSQSLQEYLINLRLVPLQSLLPRLQRVARQTCRSTGKLARFALVGGNTMLDHAILQALFPALLHLLRNAIDHGIEMPEVRLAASKNSEGLVTLQASRDGKFIVLKLKDDGAGLDLEKIRRKAQNLGLESRLDDNALTQLIFSPNFTTREQVSNISGRGVGLDIVAATIQKLQGSIQVESQLGQGLTFSIRLPLTLATLQTLFVSSGQEVFGLPTNEIARIVLQADLYFKNDCFVFEEKFYRGIHLGERVGLGRSFKEGFALFFRQMPEVALLVDKILNNQELILRPLSRYLPRHALYLGNSLRENGAVVVLLNPNVLLQMEHSPSLQETKRSQTAPRSVLVVDDSLSMRKALGELVQDAGFSVVSARDGAEAVQLLDDNITPLAILVDMEMPRMNGLELTRYVRNHRLFQKLPIAMITSRASDKHRKEAEKAGVNQYFTKPFQEEAVMSFLQQAAMSSATLA